MREREGVGRDKVSERGGERGWERDKGRVGRGERDYRERERSHIVNNYIMLCTHSHTLMMENQVSELTLAQSEPNFSTRFLTLTVAASLMANTLSTSHCIHRVFSFSSNTSTPWKQ